MDASRLPFEQTVAGIRLLEDGELDHVAMAESLAELDDSQDWEWIDSDRDRDDFYNDDILMGVDA